MKWNPRTIASFGAVLLLLGFGADFFFYQTLSSYSFVTIFEGNATVELDESNEGDPYGI